MGKAPAISPAQFKERRISTGLFFCDICGYPYPIDQMRIQIGTDGISGSSRVGVNCCYEPNGSSIDRDLLAAFAAEEAARLTEKELRPPEWNGEAYAGTPRISENPSFVVSVDPDPVVLTPGSDAVTVVLTGIGFKTGDAIAYGADGIVDADPPSLDSVTQYTLRVRCNPPFSFLPETDDGFYSFTFNGTKWPSLFDVRNI